MWKALSDYLFQFLNFLYSMTGNWGWAIVALTVIVRLALHPLNAKQMRSMQQMQRLQPRLKVLQEKYANDRDTLSRETMALYKENKVNPASGCLPLLIQLPILILLFNVLRDASAQFGEATFCGVPLAGTVLSSIAKAVGFSGDPLTAGFMDTCRAVGANPAGLSAVGVWLPITLLLLFIVFLTWYQQKLSAQGNPQMATMNVVMPIFMGFICLSMPGGLLLYWMLSSLFAVIQQWFTVHKVAKEEKPVLFKDKPREGEASAQKAVFTPRPVKENRPAPKRELGEIPSAAVQGGEVYDDFSDFIPKRHK
ncbi:YidC/Oxa1 family membrane protein insertase [Pyramidobacter piscolens]|uniref:YidC/Oxa1 family membrane protein insertase n=1 Tax=Pyramidobacter piscolens TaxID=638849 RepID=UPI00349FE492